VIRLVSYDFVAYSLNYHYYYLNDSMSMRSLLYYYFLRWSLYYLNFGCQ